MTGYSAEELQAKTWLEPTHPDDRPRDMKALTRALRGETDSWSMDKRCVRKDGSILWVSVHAAALRDEAGRTVRIVAMIEDVTARKQMEKELQASRVQAKIRAGKPMRRKKAVVRNAHEAANSKSSGKPRRPGR